MEASAAPTENTGATIQTASIQKKVSMGTDVRLSADRQFRRYWLFCAGHQRPWATPVSWKTTPLFLYVRKKKAAAILRQSSRIKNLINDLNLASKLEYNMQPLKKREENAVALVRQAAVNCINHNEDGCRIFVSVHRTSLECRICIADDGRGVCEETLEKIRFTPHYMMCDTNTTQQRHGLGLLIVKQIAASHNGSLSVGHSIYGGFQAILTLPLSRTDP